MDEDPEFYKTITKHLIDLQMFNRDFAGFIKERWTPEAVEEAMKAFDRLILNFSKSIKTFKQIQIKLQNLK